MGTPLLAGRDFNSHDDLGAPKVALVNQSFAKRFFAGKNPVGRSFRVEELAAKTDSVYEVVGLVGDTRYNELREQEPDIAFFPADQDEQSGNDRTFVIRGRGSLDSLQSAIQRETMQLNSNLLVDFRVLDVQIQQSVLRERLMANLSVAFGVLAGCLFDVRSVWGDVVYRGAAKKRNWGSFCAGGYPNQRLPVDRKRRDDHGGGRVVAGRHCVAVFIMICRVAAL
jgi:hypothetical protein